MAELNLSRLAEQVRRVRGDACASQCYDADGQLEFGDLVVNRISGLQHHRGAGELNRVLAIAAAATCKGQRNCETDPQKQKKPFHLASNSEVFQRGLQTRWQFSSGTREAQETKQAASKTSRVKNRYSSVEQLSCQPGQNC